MKPVKKLYIIILAAIVVLTVTTLDLHASLRGPGRVAKKRLSSSVTQITVYDWRGIFVRQGWGFFINKEGHIITPRSLLEGGFYIEVTTVSRNTFLVNKVYEEDVEGNFIRLGLEFPPDRFAYLDKSAPLPAIGERILVGGGIGCEPGAFLDGYVEDIRKVPVYGSLIRIGSPFATTGSPIFNEQGVLVAIVMFRLENGVSSAWAVPVGRIARVMSGATEPEGHLAWAEKRQGSWQGTSVGSYMTGLAYYWTGQHGAAMPKLMRASRDERFRQEAFYLLGCCNDAIGQYGASVDAYTMAVRLGDCSHETLLKLARAHHLQGAYQKALDTTWAAIRVRVKSYEAYTLLGEVYNSMGKYPEALAGIYIAIKMNPQRPEAYHQQGVSLRGQQKYELAIDALKKSISIDPDCSRAYWDLALTYYHSGDLTSAADICEALKKVDPELSRQLITRVKP
jgi:tetratricopeptide (TPR) repeat protein